MSRVRRCRLHASQTPNSGESAILSGSRVHIGSETKLFEFQRLPHRACDAPQQGDPSARRVRTMTPAAGTIIEGPRRAARLLGWRLRACRRSDAARFTATDRRTTTIEYGGGGRYSFAHLSPAEIVE
jgi:hypothetical protein